MQWWRIAEKGMFMNSILKKKHNSLHAVCKWFFCPVKCLLFPRATDVAYTLNLDQDLNNASCQVIYILGQ